VPERSLPLTIGSVTISPPLALAPMAGASHSAFRRMILSLGHCGLVETEMINATAFSPKALSRHAMLKFQPSEHPIAVQISGHDPQLLARAAAIAQEHGADIVDINAGCPARQVTGNASGAALLQDLDRLEAILRAAQRAITIPMTLKFRSGWDADSIVAVEVARLAEDCGCAAITLHPRTRAQGYDGRADWSLISDVVRAVHIPVIASGDIRTVEDARRCFDETACAGLMIGRGALTNPWLFSQIATGLAGEEPCQPAPADRYRFIQQYLALLQQDMPAPGGPLGKIKLLIGRMHTGLPGTAAFRRRVVRSDSLEEACQNIEAYYAPHLKPGDTKLRACGAAGSEVRPEPGHRDL